MFTKIDRAEATYEIAPMDRKWLFLLVALCALALTTNGFLKPESWFILIMGWGLGVATLLTNPKKWLSKLD